MAEFGARIGLEDLPPVVLEFLSAAALVRLGLLTSRRTTYGVEDAAGAIAAQRECAGAQWAPSEIGPNFFRELRIENFQGADGQTREWKGRTDDWPGDDCVAIHDHEVAGGQFCYGRVVENNADGTLVVHFDDGDVQRDVR
eukprot:CAMPEP_0119293828 /NCGR_PEP_ID=MMETSP1329-20130426/46801_1 /TAXON_ID=114041 /ORGANISM="Genus nov. species nov., Strain RCC1024" /LENGTH=140 /DNA_ID=CAMNT_0007294701 /DNA_START=44 /DNA_END=463 /DNA_ORIENTATION=-